MPEGFVGAGVAAGVAAGVGAGVVAGVVAGVGATLRPKDLLNLNGSSGAFTLSLVLAVEFTSLFEICCAY